MSPANTNAPRALSGNALEWRVVLLLALCAALLRLAGLGRMGLVHFDEGVYALAGLWTVSPGALGPDLIAYAPPGLPILIGLFQALLGPSDMAAILPSILCGVATVPVAAWVGRRTFGPGAGGAAAAFATLSIANIAFSRRALTDGPFLLLWLLAIGLGSRFLEKPGAARALAFGLAVGLAQNVKYNGWLAAAIVVLGAFLGILADPSARERKTLARTFGWGLLAALVAGAVYTPWFLYVQNHGGYAALVKHHQSYLTGIRSWPRNWSQQLAQVSALSGWRLWGALTWIVAWLAGSLGACGWRMVERRTPSAWTRFRVGGLLGAAFLAAIPDLAWWGGLAWFAWLAVDRRPAVRVLAAWWLMMTVLTPLYHPYARLWLPLHAAGWILMSGAVIALGPFSNTAEVRDGRDVLYSPRLIAQCAAVLVCMLGARAHWAWVGSEPGVFPVRAMYRPTDDLKRAVLNALETPPLKSSPEAWIRVLGRRPIAYYLALHGRVPFRLAAGVEDLRKGADDSREWALVDEAYLPEVRSGSIQVQPGRPSYSRVGEWLTALEPVTMLDQNPGAVYSDLAPVVPSALVLLRSTPGTLPPEESNRPAPMEIQRRLAPEDPRRHPPPGP